MATLHIAPRITARGRMFASATFYRPGKDAAQTIQDVIERSEFHYSCGRKIYDRNIRVENAIKEGDFLIEAD